MLEIGCLYKINMDEFTHEGWRSTILIYWFDSIFCKFYYFHNKKIHTITFEESDVYKLC